MSRSVHHETLTAMRVVRAARAAHAVGGVLHFCLEFTHLCTVY